MQGGNQQTPSGLPGGLHCPACGAQTPGPAFCHECGASLGPVSAAQQPPVYPPGAAQQPPVYPPGAAAQLAVYPPYGTIQPQPRRRRFPWRRLVVVWLVLLALGAAGGFAYGFYYGPGPGPDVPTEDQQAIIDAYGDPVAFVVADGPVGPGEDSARMEQWVYPGVTVYFVNGRKAAEDQMTIEGDYPDHAATPWDFDRSMKRGDVEDLLGEDGTKVPDVETDFESYSAYAYEDSRVIVGYLDGWVYAVQTY